MIIARSSDETEQAGSCLSSQLQPGDMVAFYGTLGSGKTVFARGILRGLGYEGVVASPTFSIVNEYRNGRLDVAHFDMYRIESEEALYSTGFYDYLDGRTVLLIEWSEHIEWAIDKNALRITICGAGDDDREIEIRKGEPS